MKTILSALGILLALAGGPANAKPPRIVASIKPVHSLVAGITGARAGGIDAPYLLVRGYDSPHTFSLRPSDASALAAADIVFWIGPGMARFLERPLATLAARARIVALAGAAGVKPLPSAGVIDPHIWLDPVNAKAMAGAIAGALSQADPGNAPRYRANADRLRARLDRLDAEIERTLKPVRSRPFIVLHDAYRYFGRRYRLNQVAAATRGSQHRPGARHLVFVRKRLKQTGARCLFHEPGATPGLARTIVRGSGARIAVLDPLGVDIKPGPDAYFKTLRHMARDFRNCLSRP
ncbi:MAG: zinc ABC transporter substrate-binding protein [Alphaproteobacteria bacterium]